MLVSNLFITNLVGLIFKNILPVSPIQVESFRDYLFNNFPVTMFKIIPTLLTEVIKLWNTSYFCTIITLKSRYCLGLTPYRISDSIAKPKKIRQINLHKYINANYHTFHHEQKKNKISTHFICVPSTI